VTSVACPIPVLRKQRLAYLAALLRDTAESCSLSVTLNDDEFRRRARAWLEAKAWFQALGREIEELLSEGETVGRDRCHGDCVGKLG